VTLSVLRCILVALYFNSDPRTCPSSHPVKMRINDIICTPHAEKPKQMNENSFFLSFFVSQNLLARGKLGYDSFHYIHYTPKSTKSTTSKSPVHIQTESKSHFECVPRDTQHAATHCNTLQHTATHCNTLQHTHFQSPILNVYREILRTLSFSIWWISGSGGVVFSVESVV